MDFDEKNIIALIKTTLFHFSEQTDINFGSIVIDYFCMRFYGNKSPLMYTT